MGAHLRVALTAAAAAAVLTVAACGGGQPDADAIETAEQPSTSTSTTSSTSTSSGDGLDPHPDPAVVARAGEDLIVHATLDGPVDHTLPAATPFGSPRALLVRQDQGEWLEVALPERPNGSTGWIRRDDVELRTVEQAVEVDLDARTLRLLGDGELVLTTPIAIGTAEAPTPTGDFYVVDKLATDEPGGAYGPFAFGLSAHSDVLTEFAGGDGQVGIHGTNQPSSIGQAVSHGCIRVPNDVAEVLNQLVELGTPVTIS